MKKPFICMNLTQEEWDSLCGYPASYDVEYADDYITDPIERDQYFLQCTKPSWA